MNEADPPSINLEELRLMPDWLREEGPAPSRQYASHPGETDERRRDGRDFSGPRSERRPSPRPPRSQGSSGPPRNDRGPRRPERDRRPLGAEPRAPAPAPVRAPVRVEFQPDERCLAGIVKQIRTTHLAYPLFGLARMFLQEPERHWVQLTLDPAAAAGGAALYQLGDEGPVTLDRATLERIAFEQERARFYTERTEVGEPLKGNYSNVARCRLSGTLLGPTNYHGYQPALRALYESRFSRRMPFEDFKRNIEIVTDPALVERWKEEARTTSSLVSVDGEPPTVFADLSEARAHFKAHHLDAMLRQGAGFRVHGSVARRLPEPAMMEAIREAHDTEMRYPANFVQLLRQGLQNAGLHLFKHRKRVVYVSTDRPSAAGADGALSEKVRLILDTIAAHPLCTRKTLLDAIAGRKTPAPETPAETTPDTAEDALAKIRAALGADIRFLVQAGHIIEFHNGTFDLPLPPKATVETAPAATPAPPPEAEPATTPEVDGAAPPGDA